MAKYWEIIESYGDKSRKSEAREAYECGYEEGYEAAMKEMGMDQEMEERPGYGMRYGSMGMRGRYGNRYGDINERSGQPNTFVEGEDRGSLGYRRGRDSMGRYR